MAVEQQSPEEAWAALSQGGAALVDVRTRAEWSFVGLPDLSSVGAEPVLIEWSSFPTMAQNERFLEQLDRALKKDGPPPAIYFICRSGARSLSAAIAAAAHFGAAGVQTRCINVSEGFEGDLDAEGHRGASNGWKVRGLPWRQG